MHRVLAYLGLFLVVAGPLGAFARVLPPIVGFAVFALAALIGLIALVWGMIAAVRARGQTARAPSRGLISAGLGALPVVAVGVMLVGGLGHPRINDISTDLEDPPALAERGPYPEEFAPIVREGYPDLAPLASSRPAADTFARAQDLARRRERWTVTRVDDDAMTIEGVAESGLFRFRDDFAVRVRAREGGAVVDMRSRSRVGKGDLGANANRIREFLRDLARALDQ